mgnify:CR=1 FL=1
MLVVIRGAGDLASGVALRLWRAHIQVVMTDIPAPTAIRRTVCFSQAIVHGETTVEDVTARRTESPEAALAVLKEGIIPVLADPEGSCIPVLRPDAVVDAILAKVKEIYKNEEINDIDGVKIDFPEKWVHLRKSNTEPIIRVYSEAHTQEEAEEIGQQIMKVIAELAK